MNKVLNITIVIVLIMLSFSLGYYIKYFRSSSEIKIPVSVLTKYDELKPQYEKSLGAGIKSCVKDSEKIYIVWGSGGYSGVTFYYTEDGKEIGSYYFDDTPEPNEPRPLVNIREYTCTQIIQSPEIIK